MNILKMSMIHVLGPMEVETLFCVLVLLFSGASHWCNQFCCLQSPKSEGTDHWWCLVFPIPIQWSCGGDSEEGRCEEAGRWGCLPRLAVVMSHLAASYCRNTSVGAQVTNELMHKMEVLCN